MTGGVVGAKEERFAIVGELEACPCGCAYIRRFLEQPDVEDGEGFYVVIAEIVEKNGRG